MAVIALIFTATTASATLSSLDLVTGSGAGDITFDSQTGLEWLDLTKTAGLSYNEIKNGTVTGFDFIANDGFRFATVSDVSTLFSNAGVTVFNTESATSLAPFQLLFGLMGCTGNCSLSQPFLRGYADFDVFNSSLSAAPFFQLNTSTTAKADITILNIPKTSFTSSIGSFLVRNSAEVPEPSSIILFGVGLLGLAGIRRRSKAA